ncbi:hypothetical protein TorRG33x02_278710 [Trema orientale]|uniref:Uncharacterized protein n=1 Tax=Trema orientale TaxID=63057 RepID=A0A2P5CNG1_TREOI|nr:hypothetical protein TorRG33x02_278710 [Trema orientale]
MQPQACSSLMIHYLMLETITTSKLQLRLITSHMVRPSLTTQLVDFLMAALSQILLNVSLLLRQKLGDAEAKALLSRAVYLFSTGNNDYSFPFETNSTVLTSHSTKWFVGMVLGNITEVIEAVNHTQEYFKGEKVVPA